MKTGASSKARRSTPDYIVPVLLWSAEVNLSDENPFTMEKLLKAALQVDTVTGRKADKNGIIIYPENKEEQQRLLKITRLGEYSVSAKIPSRYLFVKGVVKGVHPEVTEDELLDWVREREHPNLVEVKFLRSKNNQQTKNTSSEYRTWTALLTFSGQELPKDIRIGFEGPFPIQKYTMKPRQCLKCYGYAHVRSNCHNETRCPKCGAGHRENECEAAVLVCCNCQEAHEATEPTCPARVRQQKILDTMQENDISYRDAAREVREAERTQQESVQSQLEELKSQVVDRGTSLHNRFEGLESAYKESFRTLSSKLDELFELVLQFIVAHQTRSEASCRRQGE